MCYDKALIHHFHLPMRCHEHSNNISTTIVLLAQLRALSNAILLWLFFGLKKDIKECRSDRVRNIMMTSALQVETPSRRE